MEVPSGSSTWSGPKKFAEILKENEGKVSGPVVKKEVIEDEKDDDSLLQYKKNFHSNKLFYRVMQNNDLTEVVDQEFEYYLGDQMVDAHIDFEKMLYTLYHLKPRNELMDCIKRREKSYHLSQIAKYHSNHYYDLKGHVIRNRREYGIINHPK